MAGKLKRARLLISKELLKLALNLPREVNVVGGTTGFSEVDIVGEGLPGEAPDADGDDIFVYYASPRYSTVDGKVRFEGW